MKKSLVAQIKKGQNLSSGQYYLLYSLVFIVMAFLVFSPFLINGQSFVFCDSNQGGDGLVQHYNSFVYYGKYLRTILRTLLYEHRLCIPMWDMSIGYGQDIITTLSYYVVGDPFSFLSVFIPTRFSEAGYCFLIILRLYCAGLTFSMYCRHNYHTSGAVLAGSLIYVFSFYSLEAGVLHPYFILPMIYLPLLLTGVDHLLIKNRKKMYIAVICLSALSNFYFFYMLCIIVAIYTILRYLQLYQRIKVRTAIICALRLLLCSITGICMACVLFLPSAMNIVGTSRMTTDNFVPVFYKLSYYKQVVPAFLSINVSNVYTYMGYTGIAFLSVILLVLRARKKTEYKFCLIGFFILLLFVLIPYAGHVFNGFGYVTNRWIWALAMLAAYIVVIMLPELVHLTRKEWNIFLIVSGVYMIWVLCFYNTRTEAYLISVVCVFVLLWMIWRLLRHGKAWALSTVVLVATAVSVFFNAYYLYSPREGNYIAKFSEFGKAYDMLVKESPGYILTKAKDDSLYRFDTAALDTGKTKRNSAMQLDMNGIAFYYSTANNAVSEFNTDLYMNYVMDQSYNNLDRRSILEQLAGVKYLVVPKKAVTYLPYGYQDRAAKYGDFEAYENPKALHIGVASEKYISKKSFDSLNVIEKQQALMQGIVTDDVSNMTEAKLDFSDYTLDYRPKDADGVIAEAGKFTVTKPDAKIYLQFSDVDTDELYVIFEHMKYKGFSPSELYSEDQYSALSRYEKNQLKASDADWTEPDSVYITFNSGNSSGNVQTTLTYYTSKNNYYCGHDCFLVNLGTLFGNRNLMSLTFSSPGIYSFDSLQLTAQPLGDMNRYYENTFDHAINDLSVAVNKISGSITVDNTELLCLQIPFSDGWSAAVDGKPAEIKAVDIMFTGLQLEPGRHDIELSYQTPYLKAGAYVSALGCVMFLIISIIETAFKSRENVNRLT